MPLSQPSKPTLADLRVEIDRIDAEMHELLMARGRVIDQLIEIKTRQGGGSAFRPAREASMMRALVERHRGLLPLDTVEGIWRVIISTFTYVQAPYSIHADVSGGDAAMRDSARFHFGFTTPCVPHFGAGEVIRAVSEFGWRSWHVRRRRGARGRRLVDEAHFARGAQNYRAFAVRRARRSPSGHAGVRDLEAIGRRDSPRHRARVGDARSMALRHSARVAQDWGRSDRLGGQWDGAGASYRTAWQGFPRAPSSEALRSAGAADVRSSEVGAHADRIDASALRKNAN